MISSDLCLFYTQSLYGALPRNEQRLSGSERSSHTAQVLWLFSTATCIGSITTQPRNGQTLTLSETTGHKVVQGHFVGHDHNGSIEMHEWINTIRTGNQPASTMYYPHDNAGPDLMFALRSTTPGYQSTVLCVIQVRKLDHTFCNNSDVEQLKCGASVLKKGVRCTDLGAAYTTRDAPHTLLAGYSQQKRDLDTELAQCANTPSFKILRILVLAGETVEQVLVYPGTGCEEFFLLCDEQQTELLFGPDFRRLLAAVRHKPAVPLSLAHYYRGRT